MLLGSAIALALAYAYMEIQVIRANKKKKPDTSLVRQTGSGKAQIGGDWQLIDTEGKPFGSSNLAGTYYLIYFGFTHCPDICPNSLTKVSKAVARVKKTNEGKFFNLKTIFVSVDPDRDSP
jgi:protein SCO1